MKSILSFFKSGRNCEKRVTILCRMFSCAGMAELADALVLETSGQPWGFDALSPYQIFQAIWWNWQTRWFQKPVGKTVWVRLPLSPPSLGEGEARTGKTSLRLESTAQLRPSPRG